MLYDYTLHEIRTNTNTGIEYEIALFYKLLSLKPREQVLVQKAFESRKNASEVQRIVGLTSTGPIVRELQSRGLSLCDVSFETQNDNVGPADVVLYCQKAGGTQVKIGLSVKYSNTCTLNVTGKKFITVRQIAILQGRYTNIYLPAYKEDMGTRFGRADNWHRKTSKVTDQFIDEIRDAVIANWPQVPNKSLLLSCLFHDNSPIDFWVVNYDKKGYTLKTRPSTIDMSKANSVTVRKYETSYIAFFLGETRIARMQVKFNNGFIERNMKHDGTRKKQNPDFVQDGIEFVHGKPFGSWNFSVEE